MNAAGSLQHPLARLRDLIEADLKEVSVPYATDPAARAAQTGYAAGLHRALGQIAQVRWERDEFED